MSEDHLSSSSKKPIFLLLGSPYYPTSQIIFVMTSTRSPSQQLIFQVDNTWRCANLILSSKSNNGDGLLVLLDLMGLLRSSRFIGRLHYLLSRCLRILTLWLPLPTNLRMAKTLFFFLICSEGDIFLTSSKESGNKSSTEVPKSLANSFLFSEATLSVNSLIFIALGVKASLSVSPLLVTTIK